MARRIYIPDTVTESITTHINEAVSKAIDGFWSASEDEDSLTGHLGACLRTGTHSIKVIENDISEVWKWSIDYVKFRGRGKNAPESFLGADGIFELTVDTGKSKETKSLLFQAKTDWNHSKDIVEQALMLSTWREAAIGINYTEKLFESFSIDSILNSKGKRAQIKKLTPLNEALTKYFIGCLIGNVTLKYDARSRRLYWRDQTGLYVGVQFSIRNRIRINVESPNNSSNSVKEIKPEEIHNHRMEVDPDDMIQLILSDQDSTKKNIKRSLAMTYHPDRYTEYAKFFQDLANRRMQEINSAAEIISK